MQPEALADLAERLNAASRHHAAPDVLALALGTPEAGRIALVSSFGAESVVLLHLVSVVAPETPVLFLDTLMLFPETLAYQQALAERLNLMELRVIRPDRRRIAAADGDGALHQIDADACCGLRKVDPLDRALQGFSGWITGRKRFQAGTRAALPFFEADGDRLKVNPLAHWSPADISDYMANNALPPHPLVARGYPSIGCAPCTSAVAPGEDPRAGRWRGQAKVECGLHFVNGRAVRAPLPAAEAAAAHYPETAA